MFCKLRMLLVFSLCLLSGCMTTAAIIESPKLLSLKTEPPRFYQMSLEGNIEGKKYNIEHIYKCEQERYFTAATMTWKLRWASDRHFVVQKLSEGPTIFFLQPRFCPESEMDYFPDIGVIPDQKPLSNVIVYLGKEPEGTLYSNFNVISKGKLRRLQGDIDVSKSSSEEYRLANQIHNNISNFIKTDVHIYPESIWSTNAEAAQYYNNISVFTKAADVYPADKKKLLDRSGLYFFPVRVLSVMDKKYIKDILHYNVGQFNAKVNIDSNLPTQNYLIFVHKDYIEKDNPMFCYFGRCFEVSGSANEVYDPVTRNVIGIHSKSNLTNYFY
ncbi:MAG: hypothetical protein A2520_05505 [Deltaproteobacteria bacterium RIFOXYD12_FULL_53_23]|nr:MAG: hypothetical protein A2520_05505 [Deltaproteobacteria bacterium RIFOXYD12_FULL_53_23]